jgi:hypothetical protein
VTDQRPPVLVVGGRGAEAVTDVSHYQSLVTVMQYRFCLPEWLEGHDCRE